MLELLRAKREVAQITQVELALALGVTQTFVSKCERGERRLDVLELRKWCLAIGTTVSDFMSTLEADLVAFETTVSTLAAQKKTKGKSKPTRKQSS